MLAPNGTREHIEALPSSPGTAEAAGRHASSWRVILIALAILIAAIVLSAATLVRSPAVYGDEPWIASEIHSFVHGTGLRPTIFDGSGLYTGVQDAWNPYLGTAGFMVTALVAKPSLLAYRLTAFLISLGALGMFGWAFRRFGLAVASAATAALAASWGFIAAAHYVRWDSLSFLIVATVLALLWRGPPGRRAALLLGILLGASLDVQASVLALVPGVALLLGWQREDRWRRLGVFGLGLSVLMLAYFGVHYFSEPAQATRQWNLLLANYYTLPLQRAIETANPGALFAGEIGRYGAMTRGLSVQTYATYGTLVTLGVGAVATILGLARLRRRAVRLAYPSAAVPALLFASYVLGLPLIQGNKGAQMYAWYALPLAVAAVAALSTGGRTPRPSSSVRATAILAAALAAETGLVLLVLSGAVAGLGYEWYALPFVAVALAAAASSRLHRPPVEWACFPLLALAIVGGGYFISDLARTRQPVTDPRIVAAFHRYVATSDSVMAEPAFWFLHPKVSFHSDFTLSQATTVSHRSPTQTIDRICPNVIVWDTQWLNYYRAAPNPSEQTALDNVLLNDYQSVGNVSAAGDNVIFYRRSATSCGA